MTENLSFKQLSFYEYHIYHLTTFSMESPPSTPFQIQRDLEICLFSFDDFIIPHRPVNVNTIFKNFYFLLALFYLYTFFLIIYILYVLFSLFIVFIIILSE